MTWEYKIVAQKLKTFKGKGASEKGLAMLLWSGEFCSQLKVAQQ
jgi:hypothetical protein